MVKMRPLQFPTYVFHRDGRMVLCATREAFDALGPGWMNDPAIVGTPEPCSEPSVSLEPESFDMTTPVAPPACDAVEVPPAPEPPAPSGRPKRQYRKKE